MQPGRLAGSVLALLLLTTSPAVADPTLQQLESSTRAPVGSNTELIEPAHALPSLKAYVAPEAAVPVAGERIATPFIAAAHRLMSLTGGWRISAGISPGEQFLGVAANGRVIEDRWMNFHISVGLPLR